MVISVVKPFLTTANFVKFKNRFLVVIFSNDKLDDTKLRRKVRDAAVALHFLTWVKI